jgi:hypothetical protein
MQTTSPLAEPALADRSPFGYFYAAFAHGVSGYFIAARPRTHRVRHSDYLSHSRLGKIGEASSRGEPSSIYSELALVPART